MRFVLVYMPFGPLRIPAPGISILKSILETNGVAVYNLYLNIDFACLIGADAYIDIANGATFPFTDLIGEIVFRDALFPDNHNEEKMSLSATDKDPHQMLLIEKSRAFVDGFLCSCVEKITELEPDMIGFSSVFHQHVASLALAKKLKTSDPRRKIVFGGANCEGEMGLETLRQFDFVDYVVSGEAEDALPELVRRLDSGLPVSHIRGVFMRDVPCLPTNTDLVSDFERYPLPDYDDYFSQLSASQIRDDVVPIVPIETSRGCRHGQRSQCIFCSQNGKAVSYRKKSLARIRQEVERIRSRFGSFPVTFMSNSSEGDVFRGLLKELDHDKVGTELYFNVRTRLKPEYIAQLKGAGTTLLMAGVENFSDHVLGRMRKGISCLENILFLRVCKQYDMLPFWNFLYGTPGELEADLQFNCGIIPLVKHLQYPHGFAKLRVDRFSPLHNDPDSFGIERIFPYPAYFEVYRLPRNIIENLAYFFDFETNESLYHKYRPRIKKILNTWRNEQPFSYLFYVVQSNTAYVLDTRFIREGHFTNIDNLEAHVLRICASIVNLKMIQERLRVEFDSECTEAEIMVAVDSLIRAEFVVQAGGEFLSLALEVGEYCPPERVVRTFNAFAGTNGVELAMLPTESAHKQILRKNVLSSAD